MRFINYTMLVHSGNKSEMNRSGKFKSLLAGHTQITPFMLINTSHIKTNAAIDFKLRNPEVENTERCFNSGTEKYTSA